MKAIHLAGLVHLDVHEGNVLTYNDQYWIIDFASAAKDHRCRMRKNPEYDFNHHDRNRASDHHTICPSLRVLSLDIAFCDLGTSSLLYCKNIPQSCVGRVFIVGYCWPKEGLPPPYVMDRLLPTYYMDRYCLDETFGEMLQEYYQEVYRRLYIEGTALERVEESQIDICKEIERKR